MISLTFPGVTPAAAPVPDPSIVVTSAAVQPNPAAPGSPAVNGSVTAKREEVPEPAKDEADKMDEASIRKAYKELRAKMSGAKKEEPAADKPVTPPVPAPDATAVAAKAAYEADIDASFAAAVGGATKVDEVIKWANVNLDPASAAAFNAALDTGNPMIAKSAIGILAKRYLEANGSDPTLVKAVPVVDGGGAAGFADTSEMTAAMRDPRYEVSEAYRKTVAKRIANSKF